MKGLNKILKQLKDLIKEHNHNKKHHDSIRNVLSKLKDKELKLETQLENEKSDKKRKEIKQTLKIIYAKQKKGEKLMQEKLLEKGS